MRQFLILISLIVITGCSAPSVPTAQSTATIPLATAAPSQTHTLQPTNTLTPTATSVSIVVPTAVPAQAPSQVPTTPPTVPTDMANTYLDDRSTAQSLITSLVNALNRKEYLRAYSYWEPGASQLPPFPQFEQGYANTASVQLTTGAISGEVGAGQLYYSVPLTLIAKITSGATQTFVGCYVLHQSRPEIQAVPPFHPLAIQSAQVQQVSNQANTANLMASACQITGQPIPTPVATDPANIDATRYLDDRSDAVQVLRSLFNAINRKEDVRAYSYWESGATALPPFDQFQQGYADTQSVQLTTGTLTSDAGAGQFYSNVPVTLIAKTTNGATQTFVGCYTLHLSNPSIQGTPPFQPLAIRSANVKQVSNGANTTELMNQSCQ